MYIKQYIPNGGMVYRVGIVGSDNSHAIAFSKILNDSSDPNHVPGFEVTHLFGLVESRNEEVAKLGGIKNIVSDPIEMIGKIDIAFIEFRHGGLHLNYARPFLEKGVPLFIDKPLAADVSDARKIIHIAREKGVLITSFSTLRFTSLVIELKDLFKREEPAFLSIMGPADPESEYGGWIFYGIHVVEMFNEIVGCGTREVFAMRRGKSIMATLDHEKVLGTIKTSSEIPNTFAAEGVTRRSHLIKKLDDEPYYMKGMAKIKEMLDRKQCPLTEQEMFEPIAVTKAIEESILSGKPIKVETL